jgi:hypothetical protein
MDCQVVLLETAFEPPEVRRRLDGSARAITASTPRELVSHGLCSPCKDRRIAEHREQMAQRNARADMDLPADVLA